NRWEASGRRRVEEVDSDDDTDTQGVGLITSREAAGAGHRFASDPLRFTGIDLGDRDGTRRRNYEQASDDEGTDETSDNDSAESSEDDEILEAAMARIRRAQAKGKKDVKLSQEELKALERQRQRMQGGGQKKQKEQRFAVPLSHLEPTSRKRIDAAPGAGNSPPQPQAPDFDETQHYQQQQQVPPPQRGYPPMGYFPPPSASRAPRPRSGTGNSRPPSRNAVDREQSSSPFSYTYVQRPGPDHAIRHSSDPAARPRSRTRSIYGEPGPMNSVPGGYPSSSSGSVPGHFDPFQYMVAGGRASYPTAATGSPATRQSVSGSPRTSVPSPRTQPPGPSTAAVNARRATNREEEESSSEEETSSEEDDDDEEEEEVVVVAPKRASLGSDQGARIVTAAPPLSREASPPLQTLRRSPTKQGSGSSSRKPVGGGTTSSSRRRKK
ncbi:hypothetical protein V8F06_007236, partial [Rhypophila decipiens]